MEDTLPAPPPIDLHTTMLIQMAVREDMGHANHGTVSGDKTVDLTIERGARGNGTIVARQAGVICGTYLIEPILLEYEREMQCVVHAPDGTRVSPGQPVATIAGSARTILSVERVLLNFLGHLSGIATMTRRYVDAVAHICAAPMGPPEICDTRKTTPGFRMMDKYAVRCGGGVNHRMGLYDGVMLKDNHLAALRDKLGRGLTLAQLTARLRAQLPPEITLWLEVDTLAQLAGALSAGPSSARGADIILLDNFSVEQMRQAVKLRNDHARIAGVHSPLLEASGGVTLDTVAAIAETGVERISIGGLTHSAPAMDLSMELA